MAPASRRSDFATQALAKLAAGVGTACRDRAPKHRAEDRVALRGRLRPRVPYARPAGRARAQAREGDGRPPHGLRLARLRAERVRRLPLARPTASSSRATRSRSSASSRSTSPSTRGARRTSCSARRRCSMNTDDDLDVGEFGIATRMVQPEPGQAPPEPMPDGAGPGATMVYQPAGRRRPRRRLPRSSASSREVVTLDGERNAARDRQAAASSSAARRTATSGSPTRTSPAATPRCARRARPTGSSTSARRTARRSTAAASSARSSRTTTGSRSARPSSSSAQIA